MSKKLTSGIAFTVLSCLLALLLGGCFCFDVPPDVDAVQQQFLEHYADIQIITEFMTDAGYENIYLNDSSGTALADLNRIQITDQKVVDAAARLLDSGRYSAISKHGNTISFTQWIGLRDIRCGIAYTINGSDLPEVEFTTQLVPMDQDGWFYYVADYNEWRANRSAPAQAQGSAGTILMKF